MVQPYPAWILYNGVYVPFKGGHYTSLIKFFDTLYGKKFEGMPDNKLKPVRIYRDSLNLGLTFEIRYLPLLKKQKYVIFELSQYFISHDYAEARKFLDLKYPIIGLDFLKKRGIRKLEI